MFHQLLILLVISATLVSCENGGYSSQPNEFYPPQGQPFQQQPRNGFDEGQNNQGTYQPVNPEQMYQQYQPASSGIQGQQQNGPGVVAQHQPNVGPQSTKLRHRVTGHLRDLARSTHHGSRGFAHDTSPAMQNIKADLNEVAHRVKTHPLVLQSMMMAKPRIEALKVRSQPLVKRLSGKFAERAAKRHQENQQQRSQVMPPMSEPHELGSVYPTVPVGAGQAYHA